MTTDFRRSAPDEALCHLVLQARRTLGVGCLPNVALLEITGADARRFLQNRLSNDVSALQPGQGQMNAALDRHGGIEGVLSLHGGPAPEDFFMLIDPAEATHATAQILRYRIVERLEICPPDEQPLFYSIQGPTSPAFLEKCLKESANAPGTLPEAEFNWCDGSLFGLPVRIIRWSLSGDPGFILLVSPGHEKDPTAHPFWKSLQQAVEAEGGVVLSAEAQEILRVEAGIPRFGHDYATGVLLPETGLERQAVSYSKGCYLGQETIARV